MMARPLRIEYEGAVYHVIARGNEKRKIFCDERDFKRFFNYLRCAYERHKIIVYAYCLMGNHYHLLFETPQGNLSRIMRDLNGSYTMYFNTRYRRVGHLFQGRYKALLVDKENYLLELSRYIHLNPVRKAIVDKPEKYRYSSMTVYLGENVIPPWIDVTFLLSHFGSALPEQRKSYKRFVYERIHDKEYVLNNVYANHIIGSEEFVEEILRTFLRRKVISREVPSVKKLVYGKTLDDIAKIVSEFYKTDSSLLCKRTRSKNPVKKVFVYLSRRYTDATLQEIYKYLKGSIRESSISKICSRIEEEINSNTDFKKEVDLVAGRLLS